MNATEHMGESEEYDKTINWAAGAPYRSKLRFACNPGTNPCGTTDPLKLLYLNIKLLQRITHLPRREIEQPRRLGLHPAAFLHRPHQPVAL